MIFTFSNEESLYTVHNKNWEDVILETLGDKDSFLVCGKSYIVKVVEQDVTYDAEIKITGFGEYFSRGEVEKRYIYFNMKYLTTWQYVEGAKCEIRTPSAHHSMLVYQPKEFKKLDKEEKKKEL